VRGRQVVLKNLSPDGTLVDGNRIEGSTVLQLGQILQIGSPADELQLIACLDSDET